MDLQSDIKWIKQEIDHIDDPTFLEAIKNMLKYRSKVMESRSELSESQKKILDQRLADHKKNPTSGKEWLEVKSELGVKYGL